MRVLPMLVRDTKQGTKHIKKNFTYYIEPKRDGVRFLGEVTKAGTIVYGRNGQEYKTLKSVFEKALKSIREEVSKVYYVAESITIDGELCSDKGFKHVAGLVHKKVLTQEDIGSLVWYVFDIVVDDTPMPLYARKKLLKLVNIEAPNIQRVEHRAVIFDTQETTKVSELLEDYVHKGYEGYILKDPDAPYLPKDRKHWLKVKPVKTIDLEVVNFIPGFGKYSDSLGSLICKSADNYEISVGSGFTDELRKEIYNNFEDYRNTIVEVQYQEKTQNKAGSYSVRFPVFKAFRFDKTEPDYLGKE